MVKRTGPTNPYLKELIDDLKKKSLESKAAIWKDVADKLARPTRKRIEVNVADIQRNADNGETVLVPGVVLSSGVISKKVNVAAWKFSSTAKDKIKNAGGECLTIKELVGKNPQGSHVRIML